jgi:hypothetical protein
MPEELPPLEYSDRLEVRYVHSPHAALKTTEGLGWLHAAPKMYAYAVLLSRV